MIAWALVVGGTLGGLVMLFLATVSGQMTDADRDRLRVIGLAVLGGVAVVTFAITASDAVVTGDWRGPARVVGKAGLFGCLAGLFFGDRSWSKALLCVAYLMALVGLAWECWLLGTVQDAALAGMALVLGALLAIGWLVDRMKKTRRVADVTTPPSTGTPA